MSTLTFNPAPQRVCLLRLSAIGDTCHAVAALRALQAAWPKTHFTWIIGKVEAKLMSAILPEIEFITFDKRATLAELVRLKPLLRRRFDLLIDLQLSIRASLVSSLVRAPLKLGFDRARARELQWLFTNRKIEPRSHEHVLDSFLGFVRACGVAAGAPRWDIQLSADSLRYAEGIVREETPTLLISPCSSHSLRNWDARRYAALADHAVNHHGMRVVLVGGRSDIERRTGDAIMTAAKRAPLDQIGKDTLPQLLGLMSRSTLLLSPDSGPAHMAAMVALPVLGLYAATRTARVGPYLSRAWCIDKYEEAALRFEGKAAAELPWTRKIEKPGVMDLIEVSEVIQKLDAFMENRRKMPA
jgi:heptosyltransferase I